MAPKSKRTAAAPSGPARHPRPASSAPATKRRPSARSWAKSFRPGLGRRAGRRPPGVSEDADALGRPVGGEGAADDPLARDRTPESTVLGEATVVAHHEPVARRNLERFREIAILS